MEPVFLHYLERFGTSEKKTSMNYDTIWNDLEF